MWEVSSGRCTAVGRLRSPSSAVHDVPPTRCATAPCKEPGQGNIFLLACLISPLRPSSCWRALMFNLLPACFDVYFLPFGAALRIRCVQAHSPDQSLSGHCGPSDVTQRDRGWREGSGWEGGRGRETLRLLLWQWVEGRRNEVALSAARKAGGNLRGKLVGLF